MMFVQVITPNGRVHDDPGKAQEYIALLLEKAGYGNVLGWQARFMDGKKGDHSHPVISLTGDIQPWGFHLKVKPYPTANFAHIYALSPPQGSMVIVRKLYDDISAKLPAVNSTLKDAKPVSPSTNPVTISLSDDAKCLPTIKTVTQNEGNIRCLLLAVRNVATTHDHFDNVGLFREEVCRQLGWDDAVMLKLTRALNELREYVAQQGTRYVLTGKGEVMVKNYVLKCIPEAPPTPPPLPVAERREEPVNLGASAERVLAAIKLLHSNREQRGRLVEDIAEWQAEVEKLDRHYDQMISSLSPDDLAFLKRMAQVQLPAEA